MFLPKLVLSGSDVRGYKKVLDASTQMSNNLKRESKKI